MKFVPFETAKKLKEKGFSCEMPFAMYNEIGQFYLLTTSAPYHVCESGYKYREYYDYEDFHDHDYVAPAISQVLKWLREERNFHVSQDLMSDYSVDADGNICEEWTYWSYSIHHIIDGILYRDYNQFDHIEYQSWEEAALAGIEYVLDNLI